MEIQAGVKKCTGACARETRYPLCTMQCPHCGGALVVRESSQESVKREREAHGDVRIDS